MSFLETPRFPDAIAYGSSGGPIWNTSVVTVKSGRTIRNQNWAYPLQQFNVVPGVKTQTDYETLRTYFYAMAGRAHAFRFKDFSDYKSALWNESILPTDQVIGTGTGALATFQLRKNYTVGALSAQRPIHKPVTGTVRVAVNSVEKTITTHWTVDTTTGIITFTGGNEPGNGLTVTAGYEFDVPVEFGKDMFDISIISRSGTSVGLILDSENFPLREIRL